MPKPTKIASQPMYDRPAVKEQEAASPVLINNPWRWVILPLQFPDIWERYKVHETQFWTAEDISYDADTASFGTLKPAVQVAIQKVIAFNALTDLTGTERGTMRTSALISGIQSPEARSFFGFQLGMETIHEEVYCHLYQEYTRGKTKEEGEQVFASLSDDPIFEGKIVWLKGLPSTEDSDIPYDERLIVCVIEKTIFCAANNVLKCWARKQKILPSLIEAATKVHMDLWLQATFAADISAHLTGRVPHETVNTMIERAVETEYQFICEVLPLDDMEITTVDVREYLEALANEVLALLKWPSLYKSTRSSSWLQIRDLPVKPAKAQKLVFLSQAQAKDEKFATDAEF